MKKAIAVLVVAIITLTSTIMAMKPEYLTNACMKKNDYNLQVGLEAFQKIVKIPDGYLFQSVNEVKADGVQAHLFRFEKTENKGLQKEHFSFIISENDNCILGFTMMDKKYSNVKMVSKAETEKIAKNFLLKLDLFLAENLRNLWIERHDEEIMIDGKKVLVSGMKYKCYNASRNDYAWVIVGFDGSIITFERNIKWNNSEHKRITEKWLHDNWLIENLSTEKQELRKLVEETFINGALNKLEVEEMLRGFHPDFAILIAKEHELFRLQLHDWMKVVENYKNSSEKVKSGIRNLDYTIDVMDVTGNTAIVKAQLFRDHKIIITDYLSYIKYPDGWKAVAKISNEHIANPLHLTL
ncbi:nuclear transport factor 2 family protein [Chryseobacterium flavum]|uniref:nuclear transport factor 2 family protein n=1 Tax=Chryseobacterium flavum TaxID=415851 RepID=UPI0013006541|nr:nuclear transport factor 2 family protein [Chryseobacterium flavum]